MRNKLKLAILALAVGSFTTACQSEYDIIENGVYLTDAQSSQAKRITIDNMGAETTISSRLGVPAEQEVTVDYGTNVVALQAYNTKNGTDYQILPEKYYSFSESQAIIQAGEVSSTPVNLIIKPFDSDLDVSKKYAIPISIVNASGAEVLQASSSLMILIDQVVVTTVPYLNGGNTIAVNLDNPLQGLSAWTLEWNLCMDGFNRNNVTQWSIKDSENKQVVYSRFGDVTCEQNQFQVKMGTNKPASITRFTAKKWYHLALTYDGANIRFYVDGKLDFTMPHSTPGEVFCFKDISFANQNFSYTLNGKVSELRIWSVARSQAEIENNMYVVSSDTPGLEIYWKCNEGSGTVIKDYSNHDRDGKLAKAATWEEGVRFPDTEE